VPVACRQQHPAQPRIQRRVASFAPIDVSSLCSSTAVQLGQQLVAIRDGPDGRGLQNGNSATSPQAERLHLQETAASDERRISGR